MKSKEYLNTLASIFISLLIGTLVIIILGNNPLEVYGSIIKGAFVGNFNFGGMLEKFVPIVLTAVAFAVSTKVGVANVGVEGELYLGAMAAALVGYGVTGLSGPLHIFLCIFAAMVVGALWAAIPGFLKAFLNVNEVCTTILFNYIAISLTSYLVNHPFSAKRGIPSTPDIASSAMLTRILPPSRANSGLFIAIVVVVLIYVLFRKTAWGYKMRSVGDNREFSRNAGIYYKKIILAGMMLSGAIGGLAGSIEIIGIHGYFLDNFSLNTAFDGMLVSLIAKNKIATIPLVSLFIAILKAGALSMERFTGVPKALIDAIIATFILLACMERLFSFSKHRKMVRLTNTDTNQIGG